MKFFKKLCVAVAASALVFASASSAIADNSLILTSDVGVELEDSFEFVMPERAPEYMSYTGTVAEINPHWESEDNLFITMVDDEGNILGNVIVKADNGTYLYNVAIDEIAVGDRLTFFFEANMPMIMIYPAQYTASVIVKDFEDLQEFVKVDRFDSDMLSSDKELILSVTDETVIEYQDGTPYEGDLANQNLVVTYLMTTRSIPARIINPSKVVVLTNVMSQQFLTDEIEFVEEIELPTMDLSDMNVEEMDIVVDGNVLTDVPNRAVVKDNVIMVPLRSVAEALGFDVGWNVETQTVIVGVAISFPIGINEYTIGLSMPRELSSEAIIVDGQYTYVPMDFFRVICGVNNAYVFEGQIDINNFEKME